MPVPQEDPVKKALESAKSTLKKADEFQASAGGPMKKEAPAKAAKPAAAAAPKPKKPASEGILGDMGSAAQGIKNKADNVAEYNKAQEASGGQKIPQYEKGGKVKETGVAKVHKGETVLPANDKKKSEKLAIEHMSKKAHVMREAAAEGETPEVEAAEKMEGKKAEKKDEAAEKKGKKHDYARTEIEHHKNGTHTVKRHLRHEPSADGSVKPQEDPHTFAVQNMEELKAALEQGGEPEGAAPADASKEGL